MLLRRHSTKSPVVKRSLAPKWKTYYEFTVMQPGLNITTIFFIKLGHYFETCFCFRSQGLRAAGEHHGFRPTGQRWEQRGVHHRYSKCISYLYSYLYRIMPQTIPVVAKVRLRLFYPGRITDTRAIFSYWYPRESVSIFVHRYQSP